MDVEAPAEPKALRLARYLREFVNLRTTTVQDVDKYDSVLWFADMPNETECVSPAWSDGQDASAPWLEVRKQQFPRLPDVPANLLPWADLRALSQATEDMPPLRQTILVPDLTRDRADGEEPPMIEQKIDDHPDIVQSYSRYKTVWAAWSREYRRRNRIQSVYAELFRLHTQVQKQGEVVELVLGLGLLSWPTKPSIRRHVLTAKVDIHFNSATGVISVVPDSDAGELRIEDDMLDVRPDRRHYENIGTFLAAIGDEVWDKAQTSNAIKAWVGGLHADAEWSFELRPATGLETRPAISFAPALILRRRTQAGMVRIYDSIIRQLSLAMPDIPGGWANLVEDGDDRDSGGGDSGWRGEEVTSSAIVEQVFFPLPSNTEQRHIVEAVGQRKGVLVQGPPGTGKSHTIANLVCHLLATGKKILITAETSRALKVLKEKLPQDIQPLCISLLGQGGDSFAELNAAVQGITTRYASWRPGAYDQQISDVDRDLIARRRDLAKTNDELRELRADETVSHQIAGGAYRGTASAIAAQVSSQRFRFGWLQLPQNSSAESPLTKEAMVALLFIRRSYDDNAIEASKLRIAPTAELASPLDFGAAVSTERDAAEALQRLEALRNHSAYRPLMALGKADRSNLAAAIRELEEKRVRLFRRNDEWLVQSVRSSLEGRPARVDALARRSRELLDRIDKLVETLGESSVAISSDKPPEVVRADAALLLQHLEAGGKWTKWFFLEPTVVKQRTYIREQVVVAGHPVNSTEHLQVLCDHLDLVLSFNQLEQEWLEHGGLPKGSSHRIRLEAVKEHVAYLNDGLTFAASCLELSSRMSVASPPIPQPLWLDGQAQQWLELLVASEVDEQHRIASEKVEASLRAISRVQDLHDAHPVVKELTLAIKSRDVAAYSRAFEKAKKVEEVRAGQQARSKIENILRQAAPKLLEQLEETLQAQEWETRFAEWPEAWAWAATDNWLLKRTDFDYQKRLLNHRQVTENAIGELVARTAALRAWKHFFGRLSAKQSAALKSWREAVRALGKGTGKSAKVERLRREARQYMNECRDAIPVWVMPRYLVAEMVDPASTRYDLVIVDEASQLGAESLFLFYIAKKMIVVGDDQQISPYGVGVADQQISDLQHHFLDGIPHQHALSAQSSLYANAKIRFGENIVLREHFRCMPEIIQFSNDLCYASNGTPLDPLRSYTADRLTPLVRRHIADGFRTGSSQQAINEPEADAIVGQIVACINDDRYANKSIGVISLQGEAQAKLIERKLLEVLEPEVIEQRRLICGDAYAFQGDERHVIFLSMVAAPGEGRIGALANDAARQRFNVAASRAQDQLWLFHSATLDVLSPACMRHQLLSYMLTPARRPLAGDSQKFDSQFERDVFGVIHERGFQVRTQVSVGDPTNHRYRIDLIVEGMRGRLAVECDGDQWHGPDRYDQDMARQRDLERAGWQFVRIRGGDFYRDAAKAMEPLWTELDRLEIRPGGIDESAGEPPQPVALDITRNDLDAEEIVRDDDGGAVVEEEAVPEVDEPSVVVAQETPVIDAIAKAASTDRLVRAFEFAESMSASSRTTSAKSPAIDDYQTYVGPPEPDPRTINAGLVADGLVRIIECEGPMIAKRAYDVYLRGCGIRRLGGELKSIMNRALTVAIRQGRISSINEAGQTGVIRSTVVVKGRPAVVLRTRGPRTFEEIPPSELQAASKLLLSQLALRPESDEHLRAILEHYGLKRLTTQVGSALLDILKRGSPH